MSAPRTLAPDAMSKSGKKPKIETVAEKRVLQDETRTVEIYHVTGLPHADGMLMVYLPKEKILAYADMFNLPAADNPVPNPPVTGTMVFLANMERLKLEPEAPVRAFAEPRSARDEGRYPRNPRRVNRGRDSRGQPRTPGRPRRPPGSDGWGPPTGAPGMRTPGREVPGVLGGGGFVIFGSSWVDGFKKDRGVVVVY